MQDTHQPLASRSHDYLKLETRFEIEPPEQAMPKQYVRLLNGICKECSWKKDILWRNVVLAESRFESRFRTYHDDKGTCFLHCKLAQSRFDRGWS